MAPRQERILSQFLIAVEPTLDYQNIAPRSWEYPQQKRITLVPVHDRDRRTPALTAEADRRASVFGLPGAGGIIRITCLLCKPESYKSEDCCRSPQAANDADRRKGAMRCSNYLPGGVSKLAEFPSVLGAVRCAVESNSA